MALTDTVTESIEMAKDFCYSQIYRQENWAHNMKLLRAAGLFAGSVLLMRNYGDLMSI